MSKTHIDSPESELQRNSKRAGETGLGRMDLFLQPRLYSSLAEVVSPTSGDIIFLYGAQEAAGDAQGCPKAHRFP